MRDLVDRHTTLLADPHPTEWSARISAHGSTKHLHARVEQRGGERHTSGDLELAPVDDDAHRLLPASRAHVECTGVAASSTRAGAYGEASIGGVRPTTRSAMRRAVAIDVVMPSPS